MKREDLTYNLKYSAIGIRCDFLRNTTRGRSVYSLIFAGPDGEISPVFKVYGDLMDYWRIRRGNNKGRYTIYTKVCNGKESIHRITSERGNE